MTWKKTNLGNILIVIILLSTSAFAATKYLNTDGANVSIGNNNNVFVDTSHNRIGIGNTTPTERLTINGNLSFTGGGKILDRNGSLSFQAGGITTGATGTGSIYFLDSSGATRGRLGVTSSDLSPLYISRGGTGGVNWGATKIWTHNTSSTDNLMLVFVRDDGNAVTGVTNSNGSMTACPNATVSISGFGYYCFYYKNPTKSYSHNITVTTASGNIAGSSVSYSNVDTANFPANATNITATGSVSANLSLRPYSWSVLFAADRSGTNPSATLNTVSIHTPGAGASMTLFDSGFGQNPGSFSQTASGSGSSGGFMIEVPAGSSDYGTLYVGRSVVSSADLAEYYLTEDKTIEAGDLVSLTRMTSNKGGIRKSQFRDSDLIGVISLNPGYVLGSQHENGNGDSRMLVLSGRTPVKVSTENGEIKIGDLLTSSSIPGIAMKATGPSYVIGKSMENMKTGRPCSDFKCGKITAIISSARETGVEKLQENEKKIKMMKNANAEIENRIMTIERVLTK